MTKHIFSTKSINHHSFLYKVFMIGIDAVASIVLIKISLYFAPLWKSILPFVV